MADKIEIELGNIQKTLLLPLWGRAIETGKKNPLLLDYKAKEIIDTIKFDFSKFAKNVNPISQLAWIVRSLRVDETIKEFISRYHETTIVNIGCGLDTTFERVDDGKIMWYDLDLPDTIELRSKFISESERRKFIACSFLDDSWFDKIKIKNNVLFIAAGVLYYFKENEIKEIFTKLSNRFPGSEIYFDASSTRGVAVANKKVISDNGLDEKSNLTWPLDDPKVIEQWNIKYKVIENYPMFYKMKHLLSLKNKIGTYISDKLNIMSLVHVKFNK